MIKIIIFRSGNLLFRPIVDKYGEITGHQREQLKSINAAKRISRQKVEALDLGTRLVEVAL